MRYAVMAIALCLPLLAEELDYADLKVGDCLHIQVSGKAVKIPCPDGKAGTETIDKLAAKAIRLEAEKEAIHAQLRRELRACWSLDVIPATFEAAQAAKKVEALPKPEPEPKKK